MALEDRDEVVVSGDNVAEYLRYISLGWKTDWVGEGKIFMSKKKEKI